MSREPLAPRYRSGGDIALWAGAVRFEFAREDFARRVVAAAVRLGVVRSDAVGDDDCDALVAIALHGTVTSGPSDLAEHLHRHREALMHEGRDLAHWLRRLVMRGAWLDQHVSDGVLEPVFVEGRGFVHRRAATGAPPADDPGAPDWSALAYRRARA